MRLNIKVLLVFLLLVVSCNQNKPPETPVHSPSNFSGEKYLYIKGVSSVSKNYFITADTIQYFTGSAATAAFMEDYERELQERTFYIRNSVTDTLKIKLSDTVKITTRTIGHNETGDLAKGNEMSPPVFFKLYNGSVNKNYISNLPFRSIFANGEIIQIEEIYIP